MSDQKWVTEVVNDDCSIQYKADKVLYSKQSPFQKVEVIENKFFGKMLFNDDIVMITEKDEFIYHEMLTHVPLFSHPCPRHVLVIGGGDGGTVREVLRHPSVEKVTLVEIDDCVVEACEKFMPSVSSKIRDCRCDYLAQDGAKFVDQTKDRFDIVLIDSTDPQGPSLSLFNQDFYSSVEKILKDDGIIVSQAESPYLYEKVQKDILSIYNTYFPRVFLYKYFNMSYPLGMWCFAMGSKKHSPFDESVFNRSSQRDFETSYYSTEIHRESFVFPPFLQKRINKQVENNMNEWGSEKERN